MRGTGTDLEVEIYATKLAKEMLYPPVSLPLPPQWFVCLFSHDFSLPSILLPCFILFYLSVLFHVSNG
jgi:hypothetical protein